MSQNTWKILSKDKSENTEDVVNDLLKIRGIKTKKQKKEFFDPPHPRELTLKELGISKTEVSKAVERIKLAIKNNEKVIVYGDYDADGICATAILWETLYAIGVDVLPHVPNRFTEGYGINPESVKTLKNKYKKLSLIITVDNGIVAAAAAKECKKLNIDLIITDHHTTGKKLSDINSIIHTTKISGSGVAWIFGREIVKQIKPKKPFQNNLLELSAIGTVSDVMPMIGMNRSFVKHGLKKLNITKRVGLLALYKQASVKLGEVKSYDIGFVIAPRINAAGRLGHPIDALRMLCTTDRKRANTLAEKIEKSNSKRQKIVANAVLQALAHAEKLKDENIIVLSSDDYHEGVIGLISSRITEKLNRPSIVISTKEKTAKASARSISGFNIIKAIRKVDDLIIESGGHELAAGFSILNKNIKKFTKQININSKKLMTKKMLARELKIDKNIDFNQINWKLVSELKKFAPYGHGNKNPIFAINNTKAFRLKLVGSNKNHLKFWVGENSTIGFDAIGFGLGEMEDQISTAKSLSIAFAIDENIWNGRKSIQFLIKDIHI